MILIIATLVICGYKRKAMKEKGRSNPREELDEQIHRDVLPEFDQLRRVEQRNPLYDVYMEEDIKYEENIIFKNIIIHICFFFLYLTQ